MIKPVEEEDKEEKRQQEEMQRQQEQQKQDMSRVLCIAIVSQGLYRAT